jgi:hypothetical protein
MSRKPAALALLVALVMGCGGGQNKPADVAPGVPVNELRGVDLDFGGDDEKVMIARAPVEDVARAISKMYGATEWRQDTKNQPVEPAVPSVFVGQLRGHGWSFVATHGEPLLKGVVSQQGAKSLSEALQTTVVVMLAEDTSGAFYYEIFASGESLEELQWADGISRFASQLEDVTAQELEENEEFDPAQRLSEYLNSEDGYIASAYGTRTADGSGLVFEVAGAAPQDFTRVDYLVLP